MALLSYGEDELARRVQSLTDVQIDKINEIAKRHYVALGVHDVPQGPVTD
jgi:hypothetical protein